MWAHAATQAQADAAASEMERAVLAAESAFGGTLHDADEAVQTAMRMARDASRPVVIADAQDNPGAGGSSDTTGVLRALIRHGARDAAIGLIVDPAAALAAHHAGAGNTLRIALGGHSGIPDDAPLEAEFWSKNVRRPLRHAWRVLPRLPYGPGAQRLPEPGRRAHRGGLEQGADGRPEMFRFAGVDPARAAILVVKSSAHFRADFTSIAHAILVCAAPGSMLMDAAKQPWTRLRPGIRMAPCGPAFSSRPGNA